MRHTYVNRGKRNPATTDKDEAPTTPKRKPKLRAGGRAGGRAPRAHLLPFFRALHYAELGRLLRQRPAETEPQFLSLPPLPLPLLLLQGRLVERVQPVAGNTRVRACTAGRQIDRSIDGRSASCCVRPPQSPPKCVGHRPYFYVRKLAIYFTTQEAGVRGRRAGGEGGRGVEAAAAGRKEKRHFSITTTSTARCMLRTAGRAYAGNQENESESLTSERARTAVVKYCI